MKTVFADTLYWVAAVHPRDPWHAAARQARSRLGTVRLITTHEVLGEFLTALSPGGEALRRTASRTVRRILMDRQIEVAAQSEASFFTGLDLYERRPDKSYSLVDCISMQLMRERRIREVLTHDRHFEQEGFVLLMR